MLAHARLTVEAVLEVIEVYSHDLETRFKSAAFQWLCVMELFSVEVQLECVGLARLPGTARYASYEGSKCMS